MRNVFKKYGFTFILVMLIIAINIKLVFAITSYSVSYGFHYFDDPWYSRLNSTYDASDVRYLLSDMGYTSTYNYNWTADVAYNSLGTDQVFYFTGHGNAGIIDFYNGQERSFIAAAGNQSNLTGFKNINKLSSGKLNNVKLMVFNSCWSGLSSRPNDSNPNAYNLLYATNLKGAKCAIGFEDTVLSQQSRWWSYCLFYFLKQGENIDYSMYAADYNVTQQYGQNKGGTDTHVYSGNIFQTINLQ